MARKFEFNLEAVLTVRRHERDGERRRMAEALRALRRAKQHVDDTITAIRSETSATRGAQATTALDIGAIRGHQYFMTRLHERLRAAEAEVAMKHTEAEVQRNKLAESSKRLKAIEKLREHQLERHRAKVARAERIIEDEVAIQQFCRVHGEGVVSEIAG